MELIAGKKVTSGDNLSGAGGTANSSRLKKKRGRKAADNYLSNSKRELERLRFEYDKEKAGLHVKERAKRRNRISALESRIKKREH